MPYAGRSIAELVAIIDAEMREPDVLAYFAGTGEEQQTAGSWTAFVAELKSSKENLGIATSGLMNTWLDDAGDAFVARSNLARISMESWINAPMPLGQIAQLPASIRQTHATVHALKDSIDQANAQLANPLSEANMNGGATPAAQVIAQWERQAGEAMDQLATQFVEVEMAVNRAIPTTPWDGPIGVGASAVRPISGPASPVGPRGGPGATAPASSPSVPGSDPTAGPKGTAPGNSDTAVVDKTGGADNPAAAPGGPGGGPTGGPTGTSLAGLPNLPPPTLPSLPGGTPGGVGTLPPPPGPPPVMPTLPPLRPTLPLPGGVPVPPRAGVVPSSLGGVRGGIGGTGIASRGLGGGLNLKGISTGQEGGLTGPAQAARQMPGRPAVPLPEGPALPSSSTAPGGTGAPGAGSSMSPPMMPPLAAGGGGGRPRPGAADRNQQGKGRPGNGLPGVPPKLRGRSGKLDPTGGFGSKAAGASDRRRRNDEETIETVQLLDEELWEVKDQPSVPAPIAAAAPPRRGQRTTT
ncbi:MAG TPA: hypothetical protein VGD71_02780 [Kribbella sp.]